MLRQLARFAFVAIAQVGLISCAVCDDLETPIESSRTLSKRYIINRDSVSVRIDQNGSGRYDYLIGDDRDDPAVSLTKMPSLEDTIIVNLAFDEVFYGAPPESLSVDDFVKFNDSMSLERLLLPRMFACALASADGSSFSDEQLVACSPIDESVTLKKVEILFDPRKTLALFPER